jgi:hypothetical protein
MNCTSKDCRDAPALFNDTHSLNSDTPLEIEYHSGSINGNIMWEQVTVGEFGIGYQAMVSAEDVQNEYLGDGNFTGLLGLACESTVGRRERVSSSGFTQRGAASSAGACLKLPSVAGVPLSLRDQVK